jgi:adenylate kinase
MAGPIFVFLGPPGVGKGTQAVRLARELGISHISSGDLFRENMKNNTPLGQKAREFVDSGRLVPDELTVEMVLDRLGRGDAGKGYLLDGFPRTVAQDRALEAAIGKRGERVRAALYFAAPDPVIIERISGRRTCKACGATSHAKFAPTKKDGVCDSCGGETWQRADDQPEKVQKRLEEYARNTGPLIEDYRGRKMLLEIDATRSVEEVFAHMMQAVKYMRGW